MAKQKLYIIHGWTYTVTHWEKTIELLEKKDLTVEMLHVPGLTTSSKKVWTIEEYVKWADRNIPDGAIALGHSNGGRILLNLCSAKPEKLKQLILLDAAGVYEASSKRDVIRNLSKKFSFLKKIPGMTKVWHKLTGTTDYARAPQNMKATLANMIESDKNLDLTKVTTPTSILWGEADRVTPLHQAEIMHQQIPNSTLETFPDWTHAPYISHPVELARAIVLALRKPPKAKKKTEAVSDATKVSAALAIKRAEKPVLKSTSEPNSVAPDVPTKLTLRKEGRPTEGIVMSDAEGAAVRYVAKVTQQAKKITDTAKFSAVLALKKNQAKNEPKNEPKTDESPTSVVPENVSFVELEPIVPAGIISSADVPDAKSKRLAQLKSKTKNLKSKAKKSSPKGQA